MLRVLTNFNARIFAVSVIALSLFMGNAAFETSEPVLASTETIIVPDVLTGKPMELEVEKGASASADAAAYMYMNCSSRDTTGLKVTVLPLGTRSARCGETVGFGANSVNQVRDMNGRICIYYGSTLAGCVNAGVWAYVGNRLNYSGTLRTQR